MKNENFSKSRLYYEGLLPGNIVVLQNQAYGKIIGVSNNDEDTKDLDETQLLDVSRKIVREWGNMPNAEVDQSLLTALDHPLKNIRVMSPDGVYIEPFPMMLQCKKCGVLDFYAPFLKEDEKIEKASKRIQTIGGRDRIKCKRCNGNMVQMRYVAMHRCGYMGQLDVPWAAGRQENLGYKDQGGAFVHNSYFNVDTGEQTDHALQRNCMQCTKDYPGHDGTNKRATPVISRDKFYPHNIQYLCLKRSTGELVSDVSSLIGAPGEPLSQQGKDIAEGVFACLIGIAKPSDLVGHMRDVLGGGGTDHETISDVLKELDNQRKSYEEMVAQTKNLSEEMRNKILGMADDKIKEIEAKLAKANGRFSNARDYVNDDVLLQGIAARRRALEASLLEHDFRPHRKTIAEQIKLESDKDRHDKLIHEAQIIKTQYGVGDVVHYKEVNVVMASIGYSREKARPADDTGGQVVPVKLMGYEDLYNSSLIGKRIIYAMPAKTEAIHIKLDPTKVLRWCIEGAGWSDPGDDIMNDENKARAYLLKHSPALTMDPAEVKAETKNRPYRESAPFHLLHTISHCLLGTIKRHTGYDEKSVMEYMIPMDLSVLLYVTSVQNFTAGGLLTLFKHHLRDWFDDASNYAFNCIFDPICSDKGGTCSGCVQVVVGCETFNHGLSRCYIHGGKLEPEAGMVIDSGFWS